MKATTQIREPLYTFNVPAMGYSILIVPDSERSRAELKRDARTRRMCLRDWARDEIVGTMVQSKPDEGNWDEQP